MPGNLGPLPACNATDADVSETSQARTSGTSFPTRPSLGHSSSMSRLGSLAAQPPSQRRLLLLSQSGGISNSTDSATFPSVTASLTGGLEGRPGMPPKPPRVSFPGGLPGLETRRSAGVPLPPVVQLSDAGRRSSLPSESQLFKQTLPTQKAGGCVITPSWDPPTGEPAPGSRGGAVRSHGWGSCVATGSVDTGISGGSGIGNLPSGRTGLQALLDGALPLPMPSPANSRPSSAQSVQQQPSQQQQQQPLLQQQQQQWVSNSSSASSNANATTGSPDPVRAASIPDLKSTSLPPSTSRLLTALLPAPPAAPSSALFLHQHYTNRRVSPAPPLSLPDLHATSPNNSESHQINIINSHQSSILIPDPTGDGTMQTTSPHMPAPPPRAPWLPAPCPPLAPPFPPLAPPFSFTASGTDHYLDLHGSVSGTPARPAHYLTTPSTVSSCPGSFPSTHSQPCFVPQHTPDTHTHNHDGVVHAGRQKLQLSSSCPPGCLNANSGLMRQLSRSFDSCDLWVAPTSVRRHTSSGETVSERPPTLFTAFGSLYIPPTPSASSVSSLAECHLSSQEVDRVGSGVCLAHPLADQTFPPACHHEVLQSTYSSPLPAPAGGFLLTCKSLLFSFELQQPTHAVPQQLVNSMSLPALPQPSPPPLSLPLSSPLPPPLPPAPPAPMPLPAYMTAGTKNGTSSFGPLLDRNEISADSFVGNEFHKQPVQQQRRPAVSLTIPDVVIPETQQSPGWGAIMKQQSHGSMGPRQAGVGHEVMTRGYVMTRNMGGSNESSPMSLARSWAGSAMSSPVVLGNSGKDGERSHDFIVRMSTLVGSGPVAAVPPAVRVSGDGKEVAGVPGSTIQHAQAVRVAKVSASCMAGSIMIYA